MATRDKETVTEAETAKPASRAMWKGAISFGLVHIPVALYTATTESSLDFDWLDKRSMDPVGYKRINKKTGREIDKDNIVKGIAYADGKYVILSPEEIAEAYPKTTQSIEIEAFVPAAEISYIYMERPYYVAPINKGKKVFALLRETLAKTGRVGIARVVISTKQHLAVLMPIGPGLVLNLMRWGADVRSFKELDLPPEGAKASGLKPAELQMAERLVDDMSMKWEPESYRDEFRHEILALVDRKVKAGKTETVEPVETLDPDRETAEIIDLTELLQRSLKGAAGGTAKEKAPAKTVAAKAAPAKKVPAKAPTKTTAPKLRKAA